MDPIRPTDTAPPRLAGPDPGPDLPRRPQDRTSPPHDILLQPFRHACCEWCAMPCEGLHPGLQN
eukprot:9225845-Alexandrium_andersonii.AAC.1